MANFRTRVFSLVVAVAMVMSMIVTCIPVASAANADVATSASSKVIGLLGDVNRDGEVSIKDATLIQKYAVDSITLDDEQMILADVNGNGVVDVRDATAIQKYLVGASSSYQIGKEVTVDVPDPITSSSSSSSEETTSSSVSFSEDTSSSEQNVGTVEVSLNVSTIATEGDNSRYALLATSKYFDDTWYNLELTSENVYTTNLPTGMVDTITFYRLPADDSTNSVDNAYNKTAELSSPFGKVYVITGWGENVNDDLKGAWDIEVPTSSSSSSSSSSEATTSSSQVTSTSSEATSTSSQVTSTSTPTSDTVRIWFRNDNDWSSVHIYAYYMDGEHSVKMTDWDETPSMIKSGEQDNGKDMYYYDLPTQYTTVIFQSGSRSTQTVNVVLDGTNNAYYCTTHNSEKEEVKGYVYGTVTTSSTTKPSEGTSTTVVVPIVSTVKFTNNQGWSQVYAYFWAEGIGTIGNVEYPGTLLTEKETNKYGEEVYTANVPSGAEYVIFNEGKDLDQTGSILLDSSVEGYYTVTDKRDSDNHLIGYPWGSSSTTTSSTTKAVTTTSSTTATATVTSSSEQNVGTQTISLDVSAIASNDNNSRYAILVTSKNFDDTWYDMTETSSNVYTVNLPVVPIDSITFYRLPADDSTNSVDNAYNKTDALTLDGSIYVITGWGTEFGGTLEGSWDIELPASSSSTEATTTSSQVTSTSSEATSAPTSDTVRIWFRNDNDWSGVHIYAYYMDGESAVKMTSWDETPSMIKSGEQDNGKDMYYYDLPTQYTTVIFQSGSRSTQTVNVVLDGTNNAYYCTTHNSEKEEVKGYVYGTVTTSSTSATQTTTKNTATSTTVVVPAVGTVKFTNNQGWSQVYAYFWAEGIGTIGNVDYPGTLLTEKETNKYGEEVYTANVPEGAEYVIFNEGKDLDQTGSILLDSSVEGYYTVTDKRDSDGHLIGYPWGSSSTTTSSTTVTSTSSVEETSSTSATQTTTNNTTTSSSEATTSSSEATSSSTVVVPTVGTVKFTNNQGWSQVYAYFWAEGIGTIGNVDYPGTLLTEKETNKYGEEVYTANVPSGAEYVIFNEGKDLDQTGSILLDSSVEGYYTVTDKRDSDGHLIGYPWGNSSTTTSSTTVTSTSSVEETSSSTEQVCTQTVYLDVSAIASSSDAFRYAVLETINGEEQWFDMTEADSNLLSAEVTCYPDSIVFCIMKADDSENTVDNIVAQTEAVKLDGETYVVTGWGTEFGGTLEGDWDIEVPASSSSSEATTSSSEATTSSSEATTSSSEATTSSSEATSTPTSETVRIWFRNDNNWSNVRIYAYYMDGENAVKMTDWDDAPTMTKSGEQNEGKDMYYYDLPIQYTTVIFTSNSQVSQTENITLGGKYNAYYCTENNNGAVDSPEKVQGFVFNEGMTSSTSATQSTSNNTTTSSSEATTSSSEATSSSTVVVPIVSTVKFTNNQGWSQVYAYFWAEGIGTIGNVDYPGTLLTEKETNSYGEEVYTANVPSGAEYVIFNEGKDLDQTGSILLDSSVEGYYTVTDKRDSDGHLIGYPWGGSTTTSSSTTATEPNVSETTKPSEETSTTTATESTTTTVEQTTTSTTEPTTTKPSETESTTATTPVSDTTRIWFRNDNGWSNVRIYAYYMDGETAVKMTDWDETPTMTKSSEQNDGKDMYYYDLSTKYTTVIFQSNSRSTQTVNVTLDGKYNAFYCTTHTSNKEEVQGFVYGETTDNTDKTDTTDPTTPTNPTDPSDSTDTTATLSKDYYVFGYINGADYADKDDSENMGTYKFSAGSDGKLTVNFAQTSYIGVKLADNEDWFMTDGWQGSVTEVTLYSTSKLGTSANKLMVPAGEVVLTLVENSDGTLTLSYEKA